MFAIILDQPFGGVVRIEQEQVFHLFILRDYLGEYSFTIVCTGICIKENASYIDLSLPQKIKQIIFLNQVEILETFCCHNFRIKKEDGVHIIHRKNQRRHQKLQRQERIQMLQVSRRLNILQQINTRNTRNDNEHTCQKQQCLKRSCLMQSNRPTIQQMLLW